MVAAGAASTSDLYDPHAASVLSNYAEMEVALIVQLLLSKYQIALAPAAPEGEGKAAGSEEGKKDRLVDKAGPTAGAASTAAAGNGEAFATSDTESPFAWMLVLARLVIGEEQATWGLGLFGPDGLPPQPPTEGAGGEGAASTLATWKESGDVHGLLPRCNLQRLVGLKVPAEPCWVSVCKKGAPS
jgi:hypothetical protein